MTYDPAAYWVARGRHWAEQERAFVDVVSGLEFKSVLDVGCGPGRLGTLVRGLRPDVAYTGLDVSADVLDLAKVRIPGGSFILSTLDGFQSPRRWDLVIASELLMHVPPDRLKASLNKLASLSSGYVLTIDWTVPVDGRGAAHNFLHDYPAAFEAAGLRLIVARDVGLQTVHGLAA